MFLMFFLNALLCFSLDKKASPQKKFLSKAVYVMVTSSP